MDYSIAQKFRHFTLRETGRLKNRTVMNNYIRLVRSEKCDDPILLISVLSFTFL